MEKQAPDRIERLRPFATICRAVGFAHRNLIVHRDLTPSNLPVTRDGVVKLIDVGIARAPDPGDRARSGVDRRATRAAIGCAGGSGPGG